MIALTSRVAGARRYNATVTAPVGPSAGAPPHLGPLDRVSFLAEQRRRRRETWRLSAACTAAVLVAGLPLSAVLTPAVYAAMLLGLRVTGVLGSMPQAARAALYRQATLVPRLLDALGGRAPVPAGQLLAAGAIVVAPGIVVAFLLWLALRALLLRAGAGGVLLTLGARAPRAGDLEERQLANLAEEMAIACGVPPPRVLLLDVAAPNAASVGSRPEDSALIVTRGLLDALPRAEKEAVVAHLIGSIGNGDPRVAVTVSSAFHSMALVLTALEALVGLSGTAWRELATTMRFVVSRRSDAAAAEAASQMLSREITRDVDDGISGLLSDSGTGEPRGALARTTRRFLPLRFILFPLYLPYLLVLFLRMEIFLLRSFVAGPLVMLLWRARRYLADATAVQLTRDADALARAVARLAATPTAVPGAQWAAHLFFVDAAGGAAARDGAVAGQMGGFVGSHPSPRRRLNRIAAMGSRLAEGAPGARWRSGPRVVLALLVVGPLVLLAGWFLLAALGIAFALAGGASLLFAGLAMALLAHFVL